MSGIKTPEEMMKAVVMAKEIFDRHNALVRCSEGIIPIDEGYIDATTQQTVLGAPTFETADHCIGLATGEVCRLTERGVRFINSLFEPDITKFTKRIFYYPLDKI